MENNGHADAFADSIAQFDTARYGRHRVSELVPNVNERPGRQGRNSSQRQIFLQSRFGEQRAQ